MAERHLERARDRASTLAAKADDMETARQRLADGRDELTGLGVAGDEDGLAETRAEREEREAITAAMQAIGSQRQAGVASVREAGKLQCEVRGGARSRHREHATEKRPPGLPLPGWRR